MDIFFSSDWHIRHKNMLLYPDKFQRKPNYEMDLLFEHWMAFSQSKKFMFFFLGDLLFQRHITMSWFKDIFIGNFKQFFGKNSEFIFIRGNHDEPQKMPVSYFIDELGFDMVVDEYCLVELVTNETKRKILLSHYPCVDSDDSRGAHIRDELREIYDNNKCWANFHGHIHAREIGNRMFDGRPYQCLNIGVDRTDNKPFVCQDVLEANILLYK